MTAPETRACANVQRVERHADGSATLIIANDGRDERHALTADEVAQLVGASMSRPADSEA